MWTGIIIAGVLCFIGGVLVGRVLVPKLAPKLTYSQQKSSEEKIEYIPEQLLVFTLDTDAKQTKADASEQYKAFPPLTPERFRRRVKMLLGVDIQDYPKNALIWFGGGINYGFSLSIQYQTISGLWPKHDEAPPSDLYASYPMYQPLREYLFYNDANAYHTLKSYARNLYNNLLKKDEALYADYQFDILLGYDVLTDIFNFNISVQPEIISHIDANRISSYESYYLHIWLRNTYLASNFDMLKIRTSDIKKDLISLYIIDQMRQGRGLASIHRYADENSEDHPTELPQKNELWTGDEVTKSTELKSLVISAAEDMRERNVTSYLSFLVQLNDSLSNNVVLQFMSGQLDNKGETEQRQYKSLRRAIRYNDYYGHTVLREFCENPGHETPTLENMGASFTGVITGENSLLYLEPYTDSFDIDTIYPNETFKVYEMGYDDYYFAEVIKPVESPVAGPGGYAMIVDRTETIYGYIKKTEVVECTTTETLMQTIAAEESEQNIINATDN